MKRRYLLSFLALLCPVLGIIGLLALIPQGAWAQASSAPASAYSCSTPVRIMPLGDSITRGSGPTNYSGGYRQPVYLTLMAKGRNVNFVGSQKAPAATPAYDVDHEGHSGYTTNDIATYVYGWLKGNPADIVLLHIGTNDIESGSSDVSAVTTILNEIDRYESTYHTSVLVVVAARIIIDLNNPPLTQNYNDNLEALLKARKSSDNLVLVYFENALNYPQDMSDNLHPNKNGYIKMANVWEQALLPILPTCFSPIQIQKSSLTPTIYSGSDATFKISVTNTGRLYLYSPVVSDALAPACDQNLSDLNIGASTSYTCNAGNVTSDFTNQAQVTAVVWSDINLSVIDSGNAAVDVIHPSLAVTKVADPSTIHSGEVVTFTVRVKNDGDSNLSRVTVNDSMPGCSLVGPLGADPDNILKPNQSWSYICSLDLGNTSITNTANITATDELGGILQGIGSAQVDVIHPSMEVTKTVEPQTVHAGDGITFTVQVKNNGDANLSGIVVEDNLPGCNPSGPGGDNGNGVLDPAETWSYTCSLIAGDIDFTNTVTTTAIDGIGGILNGSSSASVDVIHPSMVVTKTVDLNTVHAGEPVTFTAQIQNNGDVDLSGVIVEDLLPDCVLTAPLGSDGDGVLKPGQIWSYTCAMTTGAQDITNTVMVTAKDKLGGVLKRSSSVQVHVIHPAVQLQVAPSAAQVNSGQSVTYTYTITNPGDAALNRITLEDDGCTPVVGPQVLQGNADEQLDPREVWQYSCTTRLRGDKTSTAIVKAMDSLGEPVTSQVMTTVKVVQIFYFFPLVR